MPSFRIIQVRFHPRTAHLTLDPPRIELDDPEALVVWNFEEIPRGWLPQVRFTKCWPIEPDPTGGISEEAPCSSIRQLYGPFNSLSQSVDWIVGLGNCGKRLGFEYAAFIRPGIVSQEKPIAASGQIRNFAPSYPSSNCVTVTTARGSHGKIGLELSAYDARICTGVSMTWDFSQAIRELKSEHKELQDKLLVPAIRFTLVTTLRGGRRLHVGEDRFGPFRYMEYSGYRIVGHGFDNVEGCYHYEAEVRVRNQSPPLSASPSHDASSSPNIEFEREIASTGHRVWKVDPTLAHEGDPPGGTGIGL